MAKKIVKKCGKHGALTAKDCYGPWLRIRGGSQTLQYNCAKCSIVRQKKSASINPEKFKESKRKIQRKYYKKNRASLVLEQKAYRLKNKQRTLEYAKAHYEIKKGNSEPMQQYKQKYGKEND